MRVGSKNKRDAGLERLPLGPARVGYFGLELAAPGNHLVKGSGRWCSQRAGHASVQQVRAIRRHLGKADRVAQAIREITRACSLVKRDGSVAALARLRIIDEPRAYIGAIVERIAHGC